MEFAAEDRRLVVKLNRGEEFIPSLVKAAREAGVTSGLVLAGIGAIREFELGWFDPERRVYIRNSYDESHELLSLQGTVTLEADPPIHLHCSLSNRGNEVIGGHLFRGTVSVLAEVAIQGLDTIRLDRKESPATGLKELTIRKGQGPATR